MTPPVRVLHIIDHLGAGGSQQLMWDLIRLADSSGVQQRVVSMTVDRGDFVYAARLAAAGVYRSSPLAIKARRASQPIWVMTAEPQPSLWRRSLGRAWRMGGTARAAAVLSAKVVAFRPDVIHSHIMNSLPAALALKKMFRRPLVHSVPCLISQMIDIDAGWLADIYRERHDEIDLFMTSASTEELRGLGIPDRKLRPIRGGVDVSAMTSATARREEHGRAVRIEIGSEPGSLLLLSVGRLHRSKGHDFALEAMPAILQAFPNAHWIILGTGEEEGVLVARARELGIEARVHLLGYRDNPLPYYAAADVYLRTNIYEAENLCSYQAMAAGLPAVGFDTGRETELVPTVGHGLLAPTADVAALAARTIDILSLTDSGRALGARGAVYAREHLDTAETIQTCVDAYVALHEQYS
jgi:glycosyltransferase involved in cell wall biosynthesis